MEIKSKKLKERDGEMACECFYLTKGVMLLVGVIQGERHEGNEEDGTTTRHMANSKAWASEGSSENFSLSMFAFQKPGNHPNLKRNASGVKSPFSEQLSASSKPTRICTALFE